MKKYSWLILYSIISFIIVYVDRITKQWALEHAVNEIDINQFLSFDLVFNRGVTAGMLQFANPLWVTVLSLIIAAIIGGLSGYTYYRWRHGHIILGEILTLSGAVSNMVDRYFFGGVIDFIRIGVGDYTFPIFNCADICIVLGVGMMFYMHMKDDL